VLSRIAPTFLALVPLLLAAQEPQQQLPVKRIVLYKNGIGYFEHLGSVRGQQDVNISFSSGQLNDVLKSLTVLDLNGGRISNVSYPSTAPAGRQLDGLRLPLGDKASLTEFLAALRGARIEVRTGASVLTGRLLSVDRKTRTGGGTTLEIDYLSLISDTGEVRTTELNPAFSVRLLEKGLAGKVQRYLDLAGLGREDDSRRMVISTEGTGERSLFVSYISEVPIWKATYRIVLGSKAGQSPLVQGWAIVDNTVGQDWEKVELSLVAGAPQSFIQNLSQPYYSRRPMVPLPQSALVTPQTYEATLRPGGPMLAGTVTDPTGSPIAGAMVEAFDAAGGVVAQATTDANGKYQFQTLPEGPARLEAQAPGFSRAVINGIAISNAAPVKRDLRLDVGSAAEALTVTASAPSIQTSASQAANKLKMRPNGVREFNALEQFSKLQPGMVDQARAQGQSAALAQELGDLFEYKLKEPVTIAKNSSALVPIVQSPVSVEKVSIWNEQSGVSRPLRALWIDNTTGLTLDGGTFSVIEAEAFAGEGIFEAIRPAEKRLVSYATDLAVNASTRNATGQQRVTRVRIAKGIMTAEAELRETKTYTFRNEDSTPRTIIVEHPVRAGYELRGELRAVESTDAWQRFRLVVQPKQTGSLVVEEARRLDTTYALTNLPSEQVDLFLSQKSIDKTVEAALRRILAQKDVVGAIQAKADALEEESRGIFDDQQRLRENMKALKGSAEEKALLQRYTRQRNDQEDRLESLKKEIKQLESRQATEQAKLDQMVLELSPDVRL
jgi:hypothetical protein